MAALALRLAMVPTPRFGDTYEISFVSTLFIEPPVRSKRSESRGIFIRWGPPRQADHEC